MSRTVRIDWEAGRVTGRWARPRHGRGPAVLLAHGAGTNQDHSSIVALRDGIAAHGHAVLTFNYPYTERGRSGPDRQPVLRACHRAAASWLRNHIDDPVVFAGRSMGGRMASLLAAEGEPMAGLILYAYPLHPAGKPDRLRVAHLERVAVPMHFFVGTRDSLCRMDLFERHIGPLPGATVTLIQDGDHSFRVPKRAGRTTEAIAAEVVERSVAWMRALTP